MPLNVTPAAAPATAANPAKYTPTVRAVSKAPSQAPIDPVSLPPGSEERPAAPARTAPPADDREKPEGAPEEEKGPDAWRFAKLAEKDRAAQRRIKEAQEAEARVKTQQAEIDARLKKLEEREKADEERRAKWRKDPKALLMDHGFAPEGALQYMLAGEKLTPEQQLAATVEERLAQERKDTESQLEALRREQEEKDRKDEEARKAAEEEEKKQEEQQAVEELHAEIGEILDADLKSYPLIAKAEAKSKGRGIAAVYAKVQEMSDKAMEEGGRRPLITTRLLEKALAAVESDARAELQETLQDENVARVLGVQPGLPRRQTTLPNSPPRRTARPEEEPPAEETPAQKRARVTALIQQSWARRQG